MNKVVVYSVLRHIVGIVGAVVATKYGFDTTIVADQTNTLVSAVGALMGIGAVGAGIIDKRVPVEKVVISEPTVIGKGFFLGERSLNNLKGVRSDLVEVITTAIITAPFDFTVTEGVRSIERQRELYQKRPRVTKTMASKHLVQADGAGHAVDLYVFDPSQPNGCDERVATYRALNEHIQEVARRLGVNVRWGGEFEGFFDGHHWEVG